MVINVFLWQNKHVNFLHEKHQKIDSGIYGMKHVLGIDGTAPVLEPSFKAATRLKCELPTNIELESVPLMEISL